MGTVTEALVFVGWVFGLAVLGLVAAIGIAILAAVMRLSASRRNVPACLERENVPRLRKGDVLLVGRRAVWDFGESTRDALTSYAIQLANVMTQSRDRRFWIHAAIYDGDGGVWEAYQPGVVRAPLQKYLKSDRYVLRALRHRFTPSTKLDEVLTYCENQEIKKYATWQVYYFVLMSLLPVSFAWALASRRVNRKFYHDDAFSCAELVVDAFGAVGYPISAREGWRVAPVDLLDSASLSDPFDPWDYLELARAEGLPGDIVALARDERPRHDQERILYSATDWLAELRRFEIAKRILEQLLEKLHGRSFETRKRLGLVLGRLGDLDGAKAMLDGALAQAPGDAESNADYGSQLKTLWFDLWSSAGDSTERQRVAQETAWLLDDAIESYEAGARRRLDFSCAVNAVSLRILRSHVFSAEPGPAGEGLSDLVAVARASAKAAAQDPRRSAWISAALGELELVLGNADDARRWFDQVDDDRLSGSEVDSIRSQFRTFEGLGFRVKEVVPFLQKLDRPAMPGRRADRPTYGRVVIGTGHRIGVRGRWFATFPPSEERRISASLDSTLDSFGVDGQTLAVTDGGPGLGVLFAELCRKRGARVRIQLPVPRAEVDQISPGDPTWRRRLRSLSDDPSCEVADQRRALGEPPGDADPFERNSRWLVEVALAEAEPRRISSVLSGAAAELRDLLVERGIDPVVLDRRDAG